jgi:hypothetical protein
MTRYPLHDSHQPLGLVTGCGLAGPRHEGGVMSPVALRELAARENDGISVRLLWHPRENAVTVSVEDTRVGDRFELAVPPGQALDAFHHPFAHAA